MKSVIIWGSLFLALTSHAAIEVKQVFPSTSKEDEAFELKMDLSFNGKLALSPHILSLPDHTASYSTKNINTNEETFVQITPSDYATTKNPDGIKIKCVIGRVKDGKRFVIAEPAIITRPGTIAEISATDNKTHKSYDFKVLAQRQSTSYSLGSIPAAAR